MEAEVRVDEETQREWEPRMRKAVEEDDLEAFLWMARHCLVSASLEEPTGRAAVFQAVHSDRPRFLWALAVLGADLSRPCDRRAFASAAFYAVHAGRDGCLRALLAAGLDPDAPCDRFGRSPVLVARRENQAAIFELLVRARRAPVDLQRVMRGFLGRRRAQQAREVVTASQQWHWEQEQQIQEKQQLQDSTDDVAAEAAVVVGMEVEAPLPADFWHRSSPDEDLT